MGWLHHTLIVSLVLTVAAARSPSFGFPPRQFALYNKDGFSTPSLASLHSAVTSLPSTTTSSRGGSTKTFKAEKEYSKEERQETSSAGSLSDLNETTVSASTSSAVRVDSSTAPSVQLESSVAKSAETTEAITEKEAPTGIWSFLARPTKSKHKQIARTLKNRNYTNKRRKALHCSFGLLFAGLNHSIPKSIFVPGMAILSSATLLMELLRYRPGFGWMNDTLHLVLGKSLRKHEMEGKFTGSFYFFTGVTLTAYLFPTYAATMGIIQLAVADPTASYFGRQTRHIYWSRIENGLGGFGRNKGFLGFLGGAACCLPVNYRILSLATMATPVPRSVLLYASVALGMSGAFADLAVPTPALVLPKKVLGVRVPPFHIDDNFVVPVFSGWACTRLFEQLGWANAIQLAPFIFF